MKQLNKVIVESLRNNPLKKFIIKLPIECQLYYIGYYDCLRELYRDKNSSIEVKDRAVKTYLKMVLEDYNQL